MYITIYKGMYFLEFFMCQEKKLKKRRNFQANMSVSQLGASISLTNFLTVLNLLFGVIISTNNLIKSPLMET